MKVLGDAAKKAKEGVNLLSQATQQKPEPHLFSTRLQETEYTTNAGKS